ncbi:MAG TPA: protoporphyrinogen oxidase [Planctomycetota bacterium]|nr:protoporphyrinogen oxidase [Planctomycetota bacterium]
MTATATPPNARAASANAGADSAPGSGTGSPRRDSDRIQGRVLDAAVIGAGVAGLTAAWQLQKAGLTCVVLEAAPRVGGKVGTHEANGFRWEAGPNTVYVRDRGLIDLVTELGGADRWTIADPRAKKRFLAIDGRLTKLPAGPLSFALSGVLGPFEKLRLFTEPFRRKGPADQESVADFARRRLGAGALQNLVAPFVSGIYAGDPEKLEAASVFPSLVDAEQAKGSILRGMLSARKTPAAQKVPMAERLRSLKGGMRTLAELLANKLNTPVRLNSPVTRILRHDTYYSVSVGTAKDEGETVRARQLILATPVNAAAELLKTLPEGVALASELAQIESCRIAVVSVGLREEQLTRPKTGFGYLTVRRPGSAPNPVLGCLWPSCMFPDRAPAGKRLITLYIGGAMFPAAAQQSDAQLETLVHEELERTLGLKPGADGKFELFFVERWERAIPQYLLGHRRRVERIQSALRDLPNLALAGNYLTGVSVAQAIESGRVAADACLSGAKVNP